MKTSASKPPNDLRAWFRFAAVAAILAGAVGALCRHGADWWFDRPHVVALILLAAAVAVGWVLRGLVTMHEVVDGVIAMASAWSTWRVFALAASQSEDEWKGLAWPLAIATACTAYATLASATRTLGSYITRTAPPVVPTTGGDGSGQPQQASPVAPKPAGGAPPTDAPE